MPEWAKVGLSCPYGRSLPLGITLPNNSSAWQYLSVVWGFTPWILCFGIGLLFLIYRGTRELAVGLLPALVAGITELIKLPIHQSRPVLSCLTTCGMPSSHSAVSVALLLYLVLDAVYRINPRLGSRNSFCPVLSNIGDVCMKMVRGFVVLPFDSMSRGEFSAYLSIWVVLLLPVPISRVLLFDHSPSQVLAGSLVGMFAASIWFPFILFLRKRFQQHVGDRILLVLVHNYDVPEGWKDLGDGTDGTVDPLVDNKATNFSSV